MVLHKGERRIALRFFYDPSLVEIVRTIPGARWSQSMKSWHIPGTEESKEKMVQAFSGKAIMQYNPEEQLPDREINVPELTDEIGEGTPENKSREKAPERINSKRDHIHLSNAAIEDIEKYRKWMVANRYPETTINTYTSMMMKLLRFVSPREAGECTAEDVIRYIEEYILPNRLSQSFQNQFISAVKKFYIHIYRRVLDPGSITRPRPRHHLPNVLSKEEVKQMLSVIANEKHRVMLSLIYACGLRRSELIRLVPQDIEKTRGLLRIRQAKGFKDRIVPVSEKTIEMIDIYLLHYKPERYLFEGEKPGDPYSTSSLAKVLKNACARAKIKKPVTLHWLRHSYATHLLESGTDLRYIQELLGHKSSRTTEIYTHVTTRGIQNIRSPFDDL